MFWWFLFLCCILCFSWFFFVVIFALSKRFVSMCWSGACVVAKVIFNTKSVSRDQYAYRMLRATAKFSVINPSAHNFHTHLYIHWNAQSHTHTRIRCQYTSLINAHRNKTAKEKENGNRIEDPQKSAATATHSPSLKEANTVRFFSRINYTRTQ